MVGGQSLEIHAAWGRRLIVKLPFGGVTWQERAHFSTSLRGSM
jgi:hypothetical protein